MLPLSQSMPLVAATLSCDIVIPCFRESSRLPSFLNSLAAEFTRRGLKGRILVVDDGSGKEEVKATLKAIAPTLEKYPDVVPPPLLVPHNGGKGHAIYTGWSHAAEGNAELLCFADADGSTNAQEVCHLIEHAMTHYIEVDAVWGSRVKMLGKHVDRSLIRHVVGRCFATMASIITGVAIYDSQCGAKVVKTSAYKAIEGTLKETGFVFDVELSLVLLKKGYHIVEVPVSWFDVAGSKVHMIRDIIKMGRGLFRIRSRHGRYTDPQKYAIRS